MLKDGNILFIGFTLLLQSKSGRNIKFCSERKQLIEASTCLTFHACRVKKDLTLKLFVNLFYKAVSITTMLIFAIRCVNIKVPFFKAEDNLLKYYPRASPPPLHHSSVKLYR